MKPHEILAPVKLISSISNDRFFWWADEQERDNLFKMSELVSLRYSIGSLMDEIPECIQKMTKEELSDFSCQINSHLGILNRMLANLDIKKNTFLLTDAFSDSEIILSPDFTRRAFLTIFNALNLLRSFDRAIKGTFHPSGEKGLKPKEATKGLVETIYHRLESKGLIHEGSLRDFEAIFSDNHLPGTWKKITFLYSSKDKSGIKTFAFELVEEITGLKVQPNCINKYFGFSDGSKTKTNNIKTAHRSKIYDTIFIKKR